MKAQIYKIHSDFYYVKPEIYEGEFLTCKLREVLKKQKLKIKVGDFVEVDENCAITFLYPPKNTLERPAVSNLDLVAVVASVLEPEIDYTQLDRYLTFLKIHKIPAFICLNKDDLLAEEELFKIKEKTKAIYEPLGYDIIFTSALFKEGLKEFKDYIKGKTVAFCGLSGVGKSSVLSAISNKQLRTGEVSKKTQRGCHTTRHVEIIEFGDIKIIDTPGFSKLTFDFILPKDLSDYFYDIKKYSTSCKFSNCLHTIEDEGCSVIKNLDKIPNTRYKSYIEFLDETKEFKQKVTFESQKKESGLKTDKNKNYTKISSKKREFSRKKLNQMTKNIHLTEGIEDD